LDQPAQHSPEAPRSGPGGSGGPDGSGGPGNAGSAVRRVSAAQRAKGQGQGEPPRPRQAAAGPDWPLQATAEQPPVLGDPASRAGTRPHDMRSLRRHAKAGAASGRRAARWAVPALALLVVLAAGYVGAAYYFAHRVPKGASVAGVEIGGLTASDATLRLEAELAERARQPVPVVVGERELAFDPVVAGLGFSAAGTVGQLTGLDFRPAWLWRQVSGVGAAPPALVVDQAALEAHLAELAAAAAVAPVDATLSVATGAPVTTAPSAGLALDLAGAQAYARQNYLVGAAPWRLPAEAVAPRIGQAELDRAVAQIAEPLLSGPVQVRAGQAAVELPVAEVAAAAVTGPAADAAELALTWDQELLAASVASRLPAGTVTNPADARFGFEGDQVVIVDGTPGTALDAASLAASMTQAALSQGEARAATAELVESNPAEGRAELEQMGVKEIVGRFETQATNDSNRTRNLRKAAEIVTGTLVRPGETFSLDAALGHRSAETGWFEAGVVIAGVSQDGIGGGLSQFSTTLYNAAHLAGMVDVEHTPHSNYFSRYPRGREATLWEGQIDNKFSNDTPYGVVLRAGVTDGLRVWVELWSTAYWTVEAEIGQPYAYAAPRTIESKAADCKPQAAGGSGFQVDYWRVKTAPDGQAQPKEEWHWRYDPMNAIVCPAGAAG
jgi:vancomycin resistance protein YoaR